MDLPQFRSKPFPKRLGSVCGHVSLFAAMATTVVLLRFALIVALYCAQDIPTQRNGHAARVAEPFRPQIQLLKLPNLDPGSTTLLGSGIRSQVVHSKYAGNKATRSALSRVPKTVRYKKLEDRTAIQPKSFLSSIKNRFLAASNTNGKAWSYASAETEDMSIEEMISASKEARLNHLEDQAMLAIQYAVENYESPVFPCALIAGDMVILDLIDRLGYLSTGKVKVMFVDTFHLFDETIDFMKETEDRYDFKANWFHAKDMDTKADFNAKYGADLWQRDIDEYDRICKVEPFQRGLSTLECDVMLNGRRRDHGFDRAFIDVYETGSPTKINPLAYWTFEDCWDYIKSRKIAYHPLHDKGYPSIGDAKDTVPVPKEKWFEYAGERSGRFTGLKNKDGSTKTECGIHVDPSKRVWDRDLFIDGSVKKIDISEVEGLRDSLVVVYAPWCPFCQRMEEEYLKFAKEDDVNIPVMAARGDEQREFSRDLGVEAFPTIFYVDPDGQRIKYPSENRTVQAWKEFLASPAEVAARLEAEAAASTETPQASLL